MTDTPKPLTAGEVDRLERGRPNMSALERALIATVRDAWAERDKANTARITMENGIAHYGETGPPPTYSEMIECAKAAEAERDAVQQDFTALQHAIVGNTGASAILTAKDLIAERDRLSRLLFSLAMREAEYRKFHDHYGADDIRTGTAWDRMRRCGDECRAVLAEDEPFDAAELEGQADG